MYSIIDCMTVGTVVDEEMELVYLGGLRCKLLQYVNNQMYDMQFSVILLRYIYSN